MSGTDTTSPSLLRLASEGSWHKQSAALSRTGWFGALATGVFMLIYLMPTPDAMGGMAHYLPLHITLEILSVTVSVLIFAVGWHTYSRERSGNIVILTALLAGVALLDFTHTLSFDGMPDFVTPSGPEKAILFWLSARALFACGMLAVALRPWSPLRRRWTRWALLSGVLLMVGVVHWVILFHQDALPRTFVEGQGLTQLKIGIEYAIVGIHAFAAIVFWRLSRRSQTFDVAGLLACNVLSAFSGLLFTRYADVTDLYNLMGHVYKVLAYWHLYRAIFVDSVRDPFIRLQQSEHALRDQVDQRIRAQAARDRLVALVEATPDFIVLTDVSGKVIEINPAASRMLGIRPDESVTDRSIYDMQCKAEFRHELARGIQTAIREGRWCGETTYCTHDRKQITVSQVILAHLGPNGTVEYISAVARDVSSQKRMEERLSYLAHRDPLTGLLNRRSFQEHLDKEIAHARHLGTEGSVLFLDTDGFKYVNDTLGHHAGDELLQHFAQMLTQRLRASDVIARLGGDEFAVLLPQTNVEHSKQIALKLLAAFRNHSVQVSGQRILVSFSIGLACFPAHGRTATELLAHADHAMYQAKDAGRGCISVFDWSERNRSLASTKLTWEARIQNALDLNRFIFCKQPIVELRSGTVGLYELLLRMRGDEGDLIMPDDFLRVAERFGLIRSIDKWVVNRAVQMLKFDDRSGSNPRLAVNLSGSSLSDDEIVRVISTALTAAGVDPARLVLEITESAAITSIGQAQRTVQALHQLGCSLAIDDFGCGFSSLSHLRSLPVDILKIDGTFIRNLAHDPTDQHLVKAMVELARQLGKQTVAEFVENQSTLDILRGMGVDYAQGYHVGRPEEVKWEGVSA